jgi:hypothetical protein
VGRDHNQDADLLSHPSSVHPVFDAACAAGLRAEAVATPDACWARLREIIRFSTLADDE